MVLAQNVGLWDRLRAAEITKSQTAAPVQQPTIVANRKAQSNVQYGLVSRITNPSMLSTRQTITNVGPYRAKLIGSH